MRPVSSSPSARPLGQQTADYGTLPAPCVAPTHVPATRRTRWLGRADASSPSSPPARRQDLSTRTPRPCVPAAIRGLSGVASAPLKLVLTPLAGAGVGAAAGAVSGLRAGVSLPILMYLGVTGGFGETAALPGEKDRQGPVQRTFKAVVGLAGFVSVGFGAVALGAAGACIGAAGGALGGFQVGLVEGYQASWDNRLPRVIGMPRRPG